MVTTTPHQTKDWVSSGTSYMTAWGLPTMILVGSSFAGHPAKTIIWSLALAWMGLACLVNAIRCGRRHCYLTGPFFLIMAVMVTLHGFKVLWLGPSGWWWLAGLLVVIGGGLLWYLPERIWGKFYR